MTQIPTQFPIAQGPGTSLAGVKPAGRIAFVRASWHDDIVRRGHEGFVNELARHGVPSATVEVFPVAGTFEIPLHVQRLAATGRYAAIVGCGFVVDDGLYRHDFITGAVIDGMMRVQLDSGVPVFSCVLTPHHFHEHAEHRRFFGEHFAVKGAEVARACLMTLESLRRIAAPA